jgi:hypothetical protein
VGSLLVGGRAPAARGGGPRSVVMAPGQTVWELAERHAPDGADPRAYVDAVLEMNHLAGPPEPGQRIRLPR